MNKKNERILLIGGCGYIGSRLFQYFTKRQYIVDTVDLEWFGNNINPNNVKINYKNLSPTFLKKYDMIVLLAGHSSIPMCENKMKETFKNNVANFVSLLHKIRDQKFIYASSSSVYGNTEELEITEKHDRYSPTNFYDLTKKEIDYYAQLSKVNYYGLRMGTVCGYSPNLRIDVMINKMFHNALIKREIVIFNKNFYRPILGIDDLCRAVENIIKKNAQPGLYNIASFNASIEEIAETVAKKLRNVTIKNVGVDATYYNFSVSTKKFENTFKFKFKESIDTIVDSLLDNHQKSIKTIRI